MPDIEICNLNQNAVLWPRIGYDQHGGPILGPPQAMNANQRNGVRWNWSKREVAGPHDSTITVDATVTTYPQLIPDDSVMWLGNFLNLLDPVLGPQTENTTGPCQVMSVKIVYNLKGRAVKQDLQLSRYRGKLPTGQG